MKHNKLIFGLVLPLLLLGGACSSSSTSQVSNKSEDNSSDNISENNSTTSSSKDNSSLETTTSKETTNNSSSTKNDSSSKETSSSNKESSSSKNTSSNKESSSSKESSKVSSSSSSHVLDSSASQPEPKSGDIYLSPKGNDNNDGSKERPYYSLAKAVSNILPGTTIYCEEGVYNYTERVNLSASGTKDRPITIQATDWKHVEFNFYGQTPGNNSTSAVGIYLTGNYWRLQGLTVCYAGDNGIKVEGSYNYIGRCQTHHNLDTGIQLGFGHNKSNPNGEECSNNLIENCDSYLNCDHDANFGADADGFACKMFSGINNVFRGCRSYHNADDAWDLYEMDFSVLIEDCWAWDSGKKEDFTGSNGWVKARVESGGMKYRGDGSFNGNGNGIKLGGNSSKGVQQVINCVAFNCNKSTSVKGFDQNHNAAGIHLDHCLAWDNGYNYMLDDAPKYEHEINNSLSFYSESKNKNRVAGELAGNTGSVTNCNFTLSKGKLPHSTPALTKDDFVSLNEQDALAERNSDGSLPKNGFGQLKTSSPYYSKNMGLKHY